VLVSAGERLTCGLRGGRVTLPARFRLRPAYMPCEYRGAPERDSTTAAARSWSDCSQPAARHVLQDGSHSCLQVRSGYEYPVIAYQRWIIAYRAHALVRALMSKNAENGASCRWGCLPWTPGGPTGPAQPLLRLSRSPPTPCLCPSLTQSNRRGEGLRNTREGMP
jgi:hypothetical protein